MKKFFLPLLCFLTLACVEVPKPPAGTISEEEMTAILIDIHIAEARANQFNLRSLDSTKLLYRRFEQAIFKKHKVDTASYKNSYQFYIENPVYMDRIYKAVIDSLNFREKIGKLD